MTTHPHHQSHLRFAMHLYVAVATWNGSHGKGKGCIRCTLWHLSYLLCYSPLVVLLNRALQISHRHSFAAVEADWDQISVVAVSAISAISHLETPLADFSELCQQNSWHGLEDSYRGPWGSWGGKSNFPWHLSFGWPGPRLARRVQQMLHQ